MSITIYRMVIRTSECSVRITEAMETSRQSLVLNFLDQRIGGQVWGPTSNSCRFKREAERKTRSRERSISKLRTKIANSDSSAKNCFSRPKTKLAGKP